MWNRAAGTQAESLKFRNMNFRVTKAATNWEKKLGKGRCHGGSPNILIFSPEILHTLKELKKSKEQQQLNSRKFEHGFENLLTPK